MEKSLHSITDTMARLLSVMHNNIKISTEHEALGILKYLNCPYDIQNKHIFNPCGAPNTWPTLVAIMEWVFKLVEFFSKNKNMPQGAIMEADEDEEKESTDKKRLSSSYMSSSLEDSDVGAMKKRKTFEVNQLSDYANLNNVPLISSDPSLVQTIQKYKRVMTEGEEKTE